MSSSVSRPKRLAGGVRSAQTLGSTRTTAAYPLPMQELLDSFYAALRKSSAVDLARLITPDFVLHWQGTPAVPWAGEWAGPEGLLRFVKVLNAHLQILSVEPLHTLHGPECSVVVLEGQWKVAPTGVEVRAMAANVFTFANGSIASYTVLNNSAAFVEALAGS